MIEVLLASSTDDRPRPRLEMGGEIGAALSSMWSLVGVVLEIGIHCVGGMSAFRLCRRLGL